MTVVVAGPSFQRSSVLPARQLAATAVTGMAVRALMALLTDRNPDALSELPASDGQ